MLCFSLPSSSRSPCPPTFSPPVFRVFWPEAHQSPGHAGKMRAVASESKRSVPNVLRTAISSAAGD